ncbi:cytochrome P450 monooxygenase [Apiospora sp. TS-2023a]
MASSHLPSFVELATQLRYNARNNPQLAAGQLAAITAGVVLAFTVSYCLYNLYLHPLRNYPGPRLWAMTRIPYTLNFFGAKSPWKIRELHAQYGTFVRVAPDIVSVSHPDALNQLQGHRKGKPENPKDVAMTWQFLDNIVGVPSKEDHSRLRRVMSHGFSAQSSELHFPTTSFSSKQSLIQRYVDLLMQRLRERCNQGQTALDMTQWFNWATFDIVGDLAFGEPFGCLEQASYHPWVSIIFESMVTMSKISMLLRFGPVGKLLAMCIIPRSMAKKMDEHNELSAMKVEKRLALETERPDLIGKMVSGSQKLGATWLTRTFWRRRQEMTRHELVSNAGILIIAGSETTASLLCGATYLLAKNQHILQKLQAEVRSSFNNETEIDLISTQKLKYMQAVLDESLRYFPPAVGALPRVTVPEGDQIAGRFVPGGTRVEVLQWALFHDPTYFHKPDEFHPERWLGDVEFKNDALAGVTPFSVGPRNCIGKNLAMSEMRLIMARIVWNFDFTLAPGMDDWYDRCQAFLLWGKPALNILFVPRSVEA